MYVQHQPAKNSLPIRAKAFDLRDKVSEYESSGSRIYPFNGDRRDRFKGIETAEIV